MQGVFFGFWKKFKKFAHFLKIITNNISEREI